MQELARARFLIPHLICMPCARGSANTQLPCARTRRLQVRTTLAVTRLVAGVADNVLPQHALVNINMRSHPGGAPSCLGP